MKYLTKIKFIYLIIALTLSTLGNAQISKAEIRATGLTCSMCSNAINKQLQSLQEVENVDIDLNTNTFIVTLKKGNSVTPVVLKQQVEKAGFFVGSLVLSVDSKSLNNYINVEKSKIPNSGKIQIQILDKGFVTDKEFKKLSKKYKEFASYLANNQKDYHFKVIN